MDLEAELDRLYRGPLGTFVADRNLLVKALKAAGDRIAAERVARLPRPTPVAWMINQLRFEAKELLDALSDAGRLLRHAQESGADGQEIAERIQDHKEALHATTERALVLALGDRAPSAAVRRQVELTLKLLSASAKEVRPPPGRMSVELEPLGFDAFTTVAAAAPKAAPRPSPSPDEAAHLQRVAAVKAALAAAEKALSRLERATELRGAAHEAALRDVADAERRVTSARAAEGEARVTLEKARAEADAARREVEDARTAFDGLAR